MFTPSLEGMKHVKSENGVILTKPFLDVCKLILPVLGDHDTIFFYFFSLAISNRLLSIISYIFCFYDM